MTDDHDRTALKAAFELCGPTSGVARRLAKQVSSMTLQLHFDLNGATAAHGDMPDCDS